MFSKDENEMLRFLVQKALDDLKSESKTILTDVPPSFVAAEAKGEDFLEGILEKLK